MGESYPGTWAGPCKRNNRGNSERETFSYILCAVEIDVFLSFVFSHVFSIDDRTHGIGKSNRLNVRGSINSRLISGQLSSYFRGETPRLFPPADSELKGHLRSN